MKKRLLALLTVVLLFASVLLYRHENNDDIKVPVSSRQATHMLTFYGQVTDLQGHTLGYRSDNECTGTAIGPHAILTARHCDEEGNLRVLTLDLSLYRYRIMSAMTDNRDHLILLIDGPPLTKFVAYEKLINIHPLARNERVYMCGDGEGNYPAQCSSGYMATAAQEGDFSEIDLKQGLVYYTISSIPGDSGSAIFGEDGRIVGVMTYRIRGNLDARSAGFTLNFTVEQILFAEEFSMDWIIESPTGYAWKTGFKLPVANPPQK